MFRNLFWSIGKNFCHVFFAHCLHQTTCSSAKPKKVSIKNDNLTPCLALETLRKVSDEVKEKSSFF